MLTIKDSFFKIVYSIFKKTNNHDSNLKVSFKWLFPKKELNYCDKFIMENVSQLQLSVVQQFIGDLIPG